MNNTIILLIVPLALIQFGLMIFNLINISGKQRTKTLSKTGWILLIILGSLVGNICYLLIEGDHHESN